MYSITSHGRKAAVYIPGSGRMVTLADRNSMPYTEAVMWETMRMRPVAGIALPHKTANDVTIGQ